MTSRGTASRVRRTTGRVMLFVLLLAMYGTLTVWGIAHGCTWGFTYKFAHNLPTTVQSYAWYLPYVFSNLIVALIISDWYVRLSDTGMPALLPVLCAVFLAINPWMILSATSGSSDAIALAAYYFLGIAAYRMREHSDVRAMVAFSFVIAFILVCDIRAIYIVPALLLTIPLLLAPGMRRQSAAGAYILLLFPAVALGLSVMYVSWMLTGEPLKHLWMTLTALSASPQYGGDWTHPLVAALIGAVVVFPAAVWAVIPLRRRRLALWPHVILIILPLTGLVLGMVFLDASTPLVFGLFLMVPTMLGGLYMYDRPLSVPQGQMGGPRPKLGHPLRYSIPYCVLLVVGVATSMLFLQSFVTPALKPWRTILAQYGDVMSYRISPSLSRISYEPTDR